MVLQAIYSSPTTPGGAGWSEDVAGDIRLGSIDGVSCEAELGATGEGGNTIDDPDGTAGHNSDGIVGLKQWALNETACPVGNQRLWTGYTADRTYKRGDTEPSGTQSSLITTVARKIDVSLVDLNWFLSFRVFAPTADDPTSDFVRPAETDLERVQALLTTVDFISTTLFDIGYIPTTGGVAMDKNDYTGKRPINVLNDCAQVSGRNFFVTYDEASGHFVLWYDVWTTDGSATLAFDSTIQLTNVLSEVDDTTTFSASARGKLDPSRIVSAIRGTGTGVTSYRTRPTTAYTFAWRDGDPLAESVKSQAKLDALSDRYLVDNSTEDNRISATVRLPAAKVTAVKAGQRIPVHFTHCPGVQAAFTWCRVLQMTIRQDVQTDAFYWLDLELSPIVPPPIVQHYTDTSLFFNCISTSWPQAPSNNLGIAFAVSRDGGSGNDPNWATTATAIGVTANNTCSGLIDPVAGTDWTLVRSMSTDSGGGQTSAAAMNYRDMIVGEPQWDRWNNTGAIAWGRPRVHYVEVSGLSGAPTVVASSAASGAGVTSVFTSPNITVGAAGFIFAGLSYRCTGPSDGASPDITMVARTPAVGLTQGWCADDFGGYSWFGYLQVSGAGTYNIVLDRSATPRDSYGVGWLMGFWPS